MMLKGLCAVLLSEIAVVSGEGNLRGHSNVSDNLKNMTEFNSSNSSELETLDLTVSSSGYPYGAYTCYYMPWLPRCSSPSPAHQGHHTSGTVLTLYHATSPDAGASILRSGFRPGHVGYCGGGIYFATSPWATIGKAVGPDSHQGFMIEARVDLGRTKHIAKPSCTSPRLGIHDLDPTPLSKHLHDWRSDSVTFNPGDGVEYAIADASRVLSTRHYQGYQYR